MPSVGTPQSIILLDTDWQGDFSAIGRELLAETAQRLGVTAATNLEYVLDKPAQGPQWQHFFDQRHDLLTQTGYEVIRNTLRFRLDGVAPTPEQSTRLVFKPFAETGKELFINTIQRIMVGSFDQRDQEDPVKLGVAQAALKFFNDLETYDPLPDWRYLAYTQAGDLVGLVVPSKIGSLYTIGYIGVVPEQRGHGYINDLLAKGTAILLAAGAPEIRTDTDVANAPMANAFRRAGYSHFADRREYRLSEIAL